MLQSSCILGRPEITAPPLRLAGAEYLSGHEGVPGYSGGINSSSRLRLKPKVITSSGPLNMPLDRHISVFAEPAFEPRNVLSLRGEATSRRPRIEIYASPCFIGALATALIIRLCPSQHNTALLVGFFIVIALRVLAVTRDIRHPTMVTMQDDEVQTTTTPLSPKISPAVKFAHGLGLPDNTGDGVRSPKSRMSTLSV